MSGMSCLSLVGMFLAIMAMPIVGILAIPVNGYDSKLRDEQKKVDNYWDSMELSPPKEENNNYWYVNSNYKPYFSNYKLHKKVNKLRTADNPTRKQDVISIVKTTSGLEYSIEVDGSLPEGAVKKQIVINY